MTNYNPTMPNKLADDQLNRHSFESEESRAVFKNYCTESSVVDSKDNRQHFTNKESYNSTPGL